MPKTRKKKRVARKWKVWKDPRPQIARLDPGTKCEATLRVRFDITGHGFHTVRIELDDDNDCNEINLPRKLFKKLKVINRAVEFDTHHYEGKATKEGLTVGCQCIGKAESIEILNWLQEWLKNKSIDGLNTTVAYLRESSDGVGIFANDRYFTEQNVRDAIKAAKKVGLI